MGPTLVDLVLFILVLVLIGFIIGIFSGMLGIGGGTIMVPVFRLIVGLDPLVSTATSLFAIIPTSISGAVTRIRQKTCIISLGIAAGLGGALTSPIGVWLSSISPTWLVMSIAALAIAYSAVSMFTKARAMKKDRGAPLATLALTPDTTRASTPDTTSKESRTDTFNDAQIAAANGAETDIATGAEIAAAKGADIATATTTAEVSEATTSLSRRQLAIGFAIALAAGLIAGYIGVGGGFLMIPLMISFIGISMKEASGSSLIAMVILAIPGVIEQAALGNIDFVVGIAVAAGSIPGAVIGAHLVKRIPERTLRFIFSGFLLCAAILLALREFIPAG